ncbi:hypothetical protein ROR02_06430 [Pararhodospirillum oryzae]|uniref:Diguanylate cyclase n=1 Tax=Pararhodospirillum oryzae TaxID=478448 RepID=A0A512H4X1_9PROT|nr:hypothetical protein ROR02_06430 [Pararhodospirillum oryzae]
MIVSLCLWIAVFLPAALALPAPALDPALADENWVGLSLCAVVGLMGLVGGVAAHTHLSNLRLQRLLRDHAEAREALRESEARLRALADTAGVGIFMIQRGRLTLVNPALCALLGRDEAALMALNDPISLVHPDDRAVARARAQARERGQQTPQRYEIRLLGPEGREAWVELSAARVTAGDRPAIIGTVYDLTERRQIEEQIRHLAHHDALTGLPNRALFSDRLQQAMARAERDDHRVALLFVDLDRFKPINDTLGHAVGDLVLQTVARRLRASLRASDTVGRVGGDEFVVVLEPVNDVSDAVTVARKLRRSVALPIATEERDVSVSSSIGIALYPDHATTEVMLCQCADLAMYAAKRAGRDGVRLFDPEEMAGAPRESSSTPD